jgi:hypothetical protein
VNVVAVLLALAVIAAAAVLLFLYGRRYFQNTAALPPPGAWPEEAHPSESTTAARLEELDELKRDGEIDETEYATRRRELLR